MIGHAKINKKALKQWAKNEKKNIINAEDKESACWYDSLWSSYFYHRQDVFKDAKPLIEICHSSFFGSLDDRLQEFIITRRENPYQCSWLRDESPQLTMLKQNVCLFFSLFCAIMKPCTGLFNTRLKKATGFIDIAISYALHQQRCIIVQIS